MKRLVVVDTSVRVLYHSILVLSLYFLFAGHNQPGGGFVGGLTAGAAISFRYVAGGVDEVRQAFRLRPWTILGGGLLVATITAIVPMVLGGSVLEHATFKQTFPLLGEVKATSALPFDIGVYLVVIGLILMMFEAFGDDVAEDEAAGIDVVGDALEADSVDTDVFELESIAELVKLRSMKRDNP
jgi:multisubunit Na+/H+ antiporter MnhB subunit